MNWHTPPPQGSVLPYNTLIDKIGSKMKLMKNEIVIFV